MVVKFLLMLFVSLSELVHSFKTVSIKSTYPYHGYSLPMALLSPENEGVETIIIPDRAGINAALKNIMETIEPLAPQSLKNSQDNMVNEQLMEEKFKALLVSIRESKIPEVDKRLIFTETNLLIADRDDSFMKLQKTPIKMIEAFSSHTSIYSPKSSPILVVKGPGKVSEKILSMLNNLGKAAQFKTVSGDQLSIIQESELKYLIRDVKSVIIAAESFVAVKQSWFANEETEEMESTISFKGLKRLLNAAMDERSRTEQDIKIVALCKAAKPPKSFASYITGDTTDLESEIILECNQRGLHYGIVKIGKLLDTEAEFPTDVRTRDGFADLNLPPLSALEETFALPLYESPIAFTNSKVVENNEYTRTNVAAETLLRTCTHHHHNSTISLLSRKTINTTQTVTESDWSDEFLKIDGPELLRIPLRFASQRQTLLCLNRVVKNLENNSSVGRLVTPIIVEKFENGFKLVFKPLVSTYVSSKEEKKMQKNSEIEENEKTENIKNNNQKFSSLYVSPEVEKNKFDETNKRIDTEKKNKTKNKLEGGVEIIVDTTPYPRVRVRRCNMDVNTVVKIESESTILKAILNGIRTLELDYKILLTSDKKTLFNPSLF